MHIQTGGCMITETLSRKRVSVQRTPLCFIVMIDAKPVMRCTARREAYRYAVLVRQSLHGPL